MESTPPRQYSIPLTKPIVTWVLLAMNVFIWLAMTLAGGSDNPAVLEAFGAKVNALIVMGEYWRLLTSCFLHIGLLHLAFNMYALYILGPELEALYGRERFTIIYLFAGLFGSLASFALNPHLSAGASGAIFGLVGALAAFYWRQRQAFGALSQRRLANMVMVIALNLFIGLTTPGIDNMAHMGGLVTGLILGWQLAPLYRFTQQPDGTRVIVDQNGWRRQWWAVVLTGVLFVWCAALFIYQQSDSAGVYLYRGQQALAAGQSYQARTEFQAAIERDSQLSAAYFGLGNAYFALHDYPAAIDAYRQTLELEPAWIEAHWNLALCYVKLGRRTEAIAAMRAYLDAGPGPDEEQKARDLITAWSGQTW
ncbi:MAG: rhomboid family intramembrane serine protease [Chloroflexi bacterium]|nr:rhomboid family intramembrane serine protease [Chloroflexota bacterium]MBU1750157.1 rhomboid family intramembrane serine protease [Chloroflexota bacterium]